MQYKTNLYRLAVTSPNAQIRAYASALASVQGRTPSDEAVVVLLAQVAIHSDKRTATEAKAILSVYYAKGGAM